MSIAQICSWPTGRNTACQRTTKDESGRCPSHRNATASKSTKALADLGIHLLNAPSTTSDLAFSGENSWMNGMKATLRNEQKEVADESFKVFVDPDKDRCQVRAACGMGKTMMEQASIRKYDVHLQDEESRSGRYLYVVPTINLANQMKNDLINDGILDIEVDESTGEPRNILVVHSESAQMKKGSGSSVDQENLTRIGSFLDEHPDEGEPRVVICVKDSIHKVAKAQKSSGSEFDIAMFDEAHNYSSNLMQTAATKSQDDFDGNGKILPIYFNEQVEGVQASNRMFLTASPKLNSHIDEVRMAARNDRNAKQKIIDLDKTVRANGSKGKYDEFEMTQTDVDVFGEFIGNDGQGWGYKHAVERGYLSSIDVKTDDVSAWDINRTGATIDRSTLVMPSGIVSGSDEGISFGAYTSIRSTAMALATSNGRNTLSFSDSIKEAKEMESGWKTYVSAEAANYNGNIPMSSERAWGILDGGEDNAEAGQWISARLQMLSETASIISTSSKENKATKDKAENFFDKKRRGDTGDCTCGRPGDKCYCTRIVSNVDMLSEGISINSIDTVVLNRPSKMSDSDITQAVGRASRVFRDESGENQKTETQVVVPRMVAPDVDGVSEPRGINERHFLKPMRAINRIMNDTVGSRLKRSDLDASFSHPDDQQGVNVDAITAHSYHGSTVSQVANKISGLVDTNPEEASMIIESWNSWETRAAARYKKENGPKSSLSDTMSKDQQFQYVRETAVSYSGKTNPKTEHSRRLAAFMNRDALESSKSYLDDLYDRAAHRDVVYQGESEWNTRDKRNLGVKKSNAVSWKKLVMETAGLHRNSQAG